MRLVKIGAVYVAESSFAEKALPKTAGFWWHGGGCRENCKACASGVGKTWWTADRIRAARLIQYADPSIVAELRDVKESQAASKATDANVEIPRPDGLDYLPFQRAGIAFATSRPGVLFGDEMGLGKTIQALGLINIDPTIKTVLCIVPASLRLNWKKEAERWLVRPMTIQVIEERELPDPAAAFVVVNYDKLIGERGKALREALLARDWDMLISDEAHYLKNPKAQRTKVMLGKVDRKGNVEEKGLVMAARRKAFLTGTLLKNRPLEAFPLLHSLAPETFPSFWTFAKRYCNAHQGRWGWDFTGASNLDELQEKMRGTCLVRRLKKDVLKELPAKRRMLIPLAVNGAGKAVEEEEEVWKRHEEALTRLQEDLDFAAASGDDEAYQKAAEALRKGHAVAFADMSRVRHAVALAKVPAVLDHLTNVLEGAEKVVVFAHHKDVIAQLTEALAEFNPVVLVGDTGMEDRQKAVDAFQNDPAVRVFVGSIGAAGVGITLTAASVVAFCELSYSPSDVSQAEDRLHRIGQAESVLVQHLVFDRSLDARMVEMLIDKQAVIDAALDNPFERTLPVLPKPRTYPAVEQARKDAALVALKRLAGVCDGARSEDMMGFNKCDSFIGKNLAQCGALTDGQYWLARRILPKYHGQIGWDLLAEIGFERKA